MMYTAEKALNSYPPTTKKSYAYKAGNMSGKAGEVDLEQRDVNDLNSHVKVKFDISSNTNNNSDIAIDYA